MKKHICIFLLLFVLVRLFAYDGPLSGEKNLSVIKTQWFDIIYPEGSSTSAAILYKNADQIYDEITSMYGITQKFRMPVVLAPGVEQFNAYWSGYPYNHIVLYDTASIEDLNVFSQTLLSTFRHELTHGVTYNHRSPFWYKVGQIFGDPINLAQITVTSGWAEGATVSSESFTGEGRLNDEYAMQMVKQAKIEGTFPKYADVQGASDLYPIGSFYYFNGAFADYLQKTYGMKCYADFWYNCVNFKAITAPRAFKKAFGCKLQDAWKDFENAYYIPELTEIESKNICNKNDGALYGYLSASNDGLVFVDQKSNNVFYLEKNQIQNQIQNQLGKNEELNKILPEKLFCLPNLESAKISKDGRFIALDVYSEEGPVIKKTAKIYNLENNAFINIDETGLQESTILKKDNDYYLVYQKFISQFNSIVVKKLNFNENGNALLSTQLISEIKFPINTVPYSFTDLENGNFAYIKKSGLNYSVCVSDLDGTVINEISAPKERMVIRYLSAQKYFNGNSQIAFSWTEPKSLPRFGKLKLDENFSNPEFYFQNCDFSGGIYWPVLTQTDEIFYIGSFFRNNKIYAGEIPGQWENFGVALNDSQGVLNSVEEQNLNSEDDNVFTESDENLPLPSAYNPFDYYKRGIIFPYSLAETRSFNKGNEYSSSLPLGVTYISSNPWTTGMAQLSAGYGFATNSFGLDCVFDSGTDTSLFSYTLHGSTEFDKAFWKQASGSISAGSAVPLGNQSYVILNGSALLHYGRSSNLNSDFFENSKQSENQSPYSEDKNYIYGNSSFSVGYSNIHKASPGRHEKIGIRASAIVAYTYNAEPYESVIVNSGNLGFATTAYIPHLVPISNPERFTINLPTKINLNLFSTSQKVTSFIDGYIDLNVGNFTTKKLPIYNAACIQAESILFGYDIQKAVPVISNLFVSDFRISIVYTGGYSIPEELKSDKWRIAHINKYYDSIKNNQMEYSDYINLKASLGIGPNFGGFARYDNKTYLYTELTWIRNSPLNIDLGIDINF